jgi:hypothetical protein
LAFVVAVVVPALVEVAADVVVALYPLEEEVAADVPCPLEAVALGEVEETPCPLLVAVPFAAAVSVLSVPSGLARFSK